MNHKTIQIRWIIVVTALLLVTTIFLYFYFFSPVENTGIFIPCGFKELTGYECVGCGGQRAMHELLHLRFLSAFKYNPFFITVLPLLLYYIFFYTRRFIYGTPEPNNFFYSLSFGRIFIVSVLIFMILRNVL